MKFIDGFNPYVNAENTLEVIFLAAITEYVNRFVSEGEFLECIRDYFGEDLTSIAEKYIDEFCDLEEFKDILIDKLDVFIDKNVEISVSIRE
jgi:hypothetical protein